jgi:hypothetical protein
MKRDEMDWVSSTHVRDQEYLHNCGWNSSIEGSSLKTSIYIQGPAEIPDYFAKQL